MVTVRARGALQRRRTMAGPFSSRRGVVTVSVWRWYLAAARVVNASSGMSRALGFGYRWVKQQHARARGFMVVKGLMVEAEFAVVGCLLGLVGGGWLEGEASAPIPTSAYTFGPTT